MALRSSSLLLWVLATLACLAAPASAIPIRWEFTATMTAEASIPSRGIVPGAPVTGYVVFESTTPDTDPGDPLFGRYNGTFSEAGLEVGDLSYSGAASGLWVVNNRNLDFHLISSIVSLPDIFSDTMFLEFVDSSQAVITTDAQPLAPPDLALIDPYDPADFTLFATSLALAIDDVFLRAEWDTITVVPMVPEPSAGLLVGLGLAAVGWVRRR